MQSPDRTESDLMDLLQNSGEWTLADDNKVCSALANLAENIQNRGNSLEKTLNNLLVRTGKLDASVQYLNVEISVLKNSKFIEVSIDDDDPRLRRSPAVVSTKSVAEQRCEVIDAVKRCVNDSLGYSATNFVQPRADKDLPPLIGSKEFAEYGKLSLVDIRPPVYEPYGTVTPPVLSPPENSSDSEEKETISYNEDGNITDSRSSPASLVIDRMDTNDNIKPTVTSNDRREITVEPSSPISTKESTVLEAPPVKTPIQYAVQSSTVRESLVKGRLFSDDSSESDADVGRHSSGDIAQSVVTKPNGLPFKRDETTGPIIRPPTSAQLANAVSSLRSIPDAKKDVERSGDVVASTIASTTAPLAAEKKDNFPSQKINGIESSKPVVIPRSQAKEEHVVRKLSPAAPVPPQKKPIGKSLFDDSDSDEDLFKPVFQKSLKQPTTAPVKTPAPEPVQKKVEQPVIQKPALASAAKETTVTTRANKYKKLFDSDSEDEDLFKSLKSGSLLNNRLPTASSSTTAVAPVSTDVVAEIETSGDSDESEEMSASKKIPGRLSSSAFANVLNSKLASGPPPPRNVTAPMRSNDIAAVPEKEIKSADSTTKAVLSAPTLTRARPPKNRKPPSRYSKNKDESSDEGKNLEKKAVDGLENGNKSESLLDKKSNENVSSGVQIAKKADPVPVKSTVATSKAVKSLFDSDDDDDNCAIFK